MPHSAKVRERSNDDDPGAAGGEGLELTKHGREVKGSDRFRYPSFRLRPVRRFSISQSYAFGFNREFERIASVVSVQQGVFLVDHLLGGGFLRGPARARQLRCAAHGIQDADES